MKDTPEWKAVLANADNQEGFYRQIAGRKDLLGIEKFYPELYETEVGGHFSNTIGANLIADLLTSPFVVVDIYEWSSEADLIKTYGVNLDFLKTLLDNNLIAIAANLPVNRYRAYTWMHEVLADKRTIFRSIRTPFFFEHIYPGLIAERLETKKRLSYKLNSMSDSEIVRISESAGPAHPAKTKDKLAEYMSWEITRVAAQVPGLSAIDYIESIVTKPESTARELRLAKFLAVSPISGALGSVQRITDAKLKSLFPKLEDRKLLRSEEWVKIEAIQNFFVKQEVRATRADLSSEQYWQRFSESEYERLKLLDILKNSEERTERIIVESNLRLRVARHEDVTHDEIEEYARRDEKLFDRIGEYCELGLFGVQAAFYFLGAKKVIALWEGISGILGCEVVKKIGRKTLEHAIPRVHIVSYIKKKQKH